MSILKKEKYNPGDSFSGVQFRLLLWRFTFEILEEEGAWIFGVSPSRAQSTLRKKYLEMDMYAGDKGKGTEGYLAYNCHNQFLQEMLQSGVVGLCALLYWCVVLLKVCIYKRDIVMYALVFVIFCFFFSDTPLERQYGIVLCTIFPLILAYSHCTSRYRV
jgi:O-antigen ligase